MSRPVYQGGYEITPRINQVQAALDAKDNEAVQVLVHVVNIAVC